MSNHNEIAHNWAHQTGRKCRGFNMFYDGPTIYSYGRHFPIARHTVDAHGQPLILFTTATYSTSTAKHKSYTARAIPSSMRVFGVGNVDAAFRLDHEANHRDLVERMNNALQAAAKARKYGDMHLDSAQRLADSANAYNEAFQLGLPAVALPADLEGVKARIAAAKVAEIAAAKAADLKAQEAVDKWVAGETDSVPHTRLPHVRVKGEEVQTSWGIRVPLAQALPLFRIAQRCAERAAEFVPTEPMAVGNWRLDRIEANGTIRAGCHVIPFDRQQVAAQLAGL